MNDMSEYGEKAMQVLRDGGEVEVRERSIIYRSVPTVIEDHGYYQVERRVNSQPVRADEDYIAYQIMHEPAKTNSYGWLIVTFILIVSAVVVALAGKVTDIAIDLNDAGTGAVLLALVIVGGLGYLASLIFSVVRK